MEFTDLNQRERYGEIALRGRHYPVFRDGQGPVPCLCLGIGSLYQRTLSARFRDYFTLYTSDFYWVTQKAPFNVNELTIESLCFDLLETAKQLNLKQYILLGHSVFGGLAIEVAKYQDPELRGVIGIAGTPGWDQDVIQFKNTYFEQFASPRRKQRFLALQAEYEATRNPKDSLASPSAYYAESPKYFANDVSLEDIAALWEGINCDDEVINHLFENLLAQYQFEKHIEKVNVPVMIAGGQKDFDSVPLEIWKHYQTPKQFTLLDCGDVGHWLHLEAPEVFDRGVKEWLDPTPT